MNKLYGFFLHNCREPSHTENTICDKELFNVKCMLDVGQVGGNLALPGAFSEICCEQAIKFYLYVLEISF